MSASLLSLVEALTFESTFELVRVDVPEGGIAVTVECVGVRCWSS